MNVTIKYLNAKCVSQFSEFAANGTLVLVTPPFRIAIKTGNCTLTLLLRTKSNNVFNRRVSRLNYYYQAAALTRLRQHLQINIHVLNINMWSVITLTIYWFKQYSSLANILSNEHANKFSTVNYSFHNMVIGLFTLLQHNVFVHQII